MSEMIEEVKRLMGADRINISELWLVINKVVSNVDWLLARDAPLMDLKSKIAALEDEAVSMRRMLLSLQTDIDDHVYQHEAVSRETEEEDPQLW